MHLDPLNRLPPAPAVQVRPQSPARDEDQFDYPSTQGLALVDTPLMTFPEEAQPPALPEPSPSQRQAMLSAECAIRTEMTQPPELTLITASVRAIFAAARPERLWVHEGSALVLFARYRAWAETLDMGADRLARLDGWMANYAATVGVTAESVEMVGLALLDRQHPAVLWAWRDNDLEALIGNQKPANPRDMLNDYALLPLPWRHIVGCAVGTRLTEPMPCMQAHSVRWNAFLWECFACLPDAVQPQRMLSMASQPGFAMMRSRTQGLRPKNSAGQEVYNDWVHVVLQATPAQREGLFGTFVTNRMLQQAAPKLVVGLLQALPRWRTPYWQQLIPANHDMPADLAPQLLALLPERVEGDMLARGRPLACYFPEKHWQYVAQGYVGGHYTPCLTEELERMEVLKACLDGTPLPEHGADSPGLQLARDPQGWVQRGDWSALQAPWLSQMLQNETVKTGCDARLAQDNRLQALGCYLHVCGEIGFDASAQPGATLLPMLLQLPGQAERRALLKLHLSKMHNPYTREAWEQTVQKVLQTHSSEHARALALALLGMHNVDVDQPAVRALLRTRAVSHAGNSALRLLSLAVRLFSGAHGFPSRFMVSLFDWPNAARLFGLLAWAGPKEDPLVHVQAGNEAACREAMQRSESVSLTAHALLQRCQRHHVPESARAYVRNERQRLEASATWLTSQPALQAVGTALLACLGNTQAPQHGRDALAEARRLPRGVQRSFCEMLCQQVSRVHATGKAKSSEQLDEAFFQQAAVRQFFNGHVMPMILMMQEHSAALTDMGKMPDKVPTPDALRSCCLAFLPESSAEADWQVLTAKVHKASNLAVYWQCAKNWVPRWGATREAFQRVVRAVIDDSYASMRRDSAQMRAVLAHPQGQNILPLWEPDHQEAHLIHGARYTIEDSANPGKMLAAVTDIRSCQSVHDSGGYNVGMLGRLVCGSRRMLTVRDAHGKLRARTALRLYVGPNDEPVLTRSMIYDANPPAGMVEVLNAYVARRAAAMGIAAASDYPGGGDTHLRIVQGEMPDYFDGGTHLSLLQSVWTDLLPATAAQRHLPIAGNGEAL